MLENVLLHHYLLREGEPSNLRRLSKDVVEHKWAQISGTNLFGSKAQESPILLHYLLVYKNNLGQDLQLNENNYVFLIPPRTHWSL